MSVLILSMDATIVNVALPAIQKDLHARMAGLQWILDAYTLVIASFLMLSGSISDRYGRRRVFSNRAESIHARIDLVQPGQDD